jgi:hypothetical protein
MGKYFKNIPCHSGGIFWINFTMCGIIFYDVAKYPTTFTKYFSTSHGI